MKSRAVRNTEVNDYSGRFGDIWEFKPGVWHAIEFTSSGKELLRRGIPDSELSYWLHRLRVPASSSAQDTLRNNFPGTVEEIQERYRLLSKRPKLRNSTP